MNASIKIDYTAGPRATVTVHDGLAYALGAMGHLHCFDAATGDIVWKRDLNAEYNINMPIWGIASAPIVEAENLIVQIGGKPNACIVAFDRKTGEEKWKALDDKRLLFRTDCHYTSRQTRSCLLDGRKYSGTQPTNR